MANRRKLTHPETKKWETEGMPEEMKGDRTNWKGQRNEVLYRQDSELTAKLGRIGWRIEIHAARRP